MELHNPKKGQDNKKIVERGRGGTCVVCEQVKHLIALMQLKQKVDKIT
jgi:hypothetical protein